MSPSPFYSGHTSFLPYLLNRVTLLLNQEFQKELDARRITLTQWRVLAFLNEHDGLSVGALAEAAVTEQTSLSRAVAALEQRGLVTPRSRQENGRAAELCLSPAGRELFASMLETAVGLDARATTGVSESELSFFQELLWRMTANLQEQPSPTG